MAKNVKPRNKVVPLFVWGFRIAPFYLLAIHMGSDTWVPIIAKLLK